MPNFETNEKSNQHEEDIERLSEIIHRYTLLPKNRILQFIRTYGLQRMIPSINILCETENQRKKLAEMIEFRNLYDEVSNVPEDKYVLRNNQDAGKYFTHFFNGMNDKERIAAAFLDTANSIIATKILFEGTINESYFYPRELIKDALFFNATSIMLAHNHPSGGMVESPPDVELTKKIKGILDTVNIKLLDHLIVYNNNYLSLCEKQPFLFVDTKDIKFNKIREIKEENDLDYELE